MKQMQNKLPLVDPIKDMKINDDSLDKLLERKEKLVEAEGKLA